MQPEGPRKHHMEGSCDDSVLVWQDLGSAGTIRVKRNLLNRFDDDDQQHFKYFIFCMEAGGGDMKLNKAMGYQCRIDSTIF